LTSKPTPASHRSLDHTADAGVEIDAPSREALFAEAAIALADTLTPIVGVGGTVERVLELEAADDELLLVDFLNEILFLFETEGLVFAGAAVRLEGGGEASSPVRLRATLRGEEYDEAKHPLRSLIKAVTYHGLSVRRQGERFAGRVLFDL
jgi:SHS2 domain-containing protein